MTASISLSLNVCRQAFNDLIEEIQGSAQGKLEGLYLQDWEDERGRLRMWAANIGAHQTGQSSLDFRLRDSSHIQQQITKLLEDLLRRLKDVRGILAKGQGVDDGDSDVESIGYSSSEDEAPQTELHQLRRNVATIINWLFEMSILVRKPAQHDIRIGAKQSDVSGYEWADLRHVKVKFPTVNDPLAARLGQAITRRRKYLAYRKRHADKLRKGIDHDVHTGSAILSETVATDVRTWNIDADDRASDSGFSQTSYAPTLMSGGAITIPSPPEASHNGTPFECPYCYYVITAPSTKSWNRHVFYDLQPYLCTEPRCTTPDRLYTTRHEWIHHLRTAHDHAVNSLHTCTLCGDSESTLERYHQHVAQHLQELALFILPRKDGDDSDEDDSDAKLGAHSSRGSSTSITMGDKAVDLFVYDAPTEAADDAKVVDEFSPPRARSPSYDDDDSWDGRAHRPRRYRKGSVSSQARDRSRDRSRRRSRADSSRYRSRERKMTEIEELEGKERGKRVPDALSAAKNKIEEACTKRVLAETEQEKQEKEMKEKNLRERRKTKHSRRD
ncbi:MAG: hypothetical protein Q9177_004837 [Variospora cf. flavescens]